MSKRYDNQWKKGKSRPAPAAPKRARPKSPLDRASLRLGRATKLLDSLAENDARIAAAAGPVLNAEGFPYGTWVPESLATRLMLEGRETDARWVTAFIASRKGLYAAHRAWAEARDEYERLRGHGPATGLLKATSSVKPPWED